MKPLKECTCGRIRLFALIAATIIFLVPPTAVAQDDPGPYPVEPLPEDSDILIELEEGARIARPDKPQVQHMTADLHPDQFILPSPGPAAPQHLPSSAPLDPLPKTPFQPQQLQAMPDLTVVDIWSTTNPLQAGQEENVTFQIKNQGTAAISTQFLIRFSVDGVSKATWSSGGLAVGQVAQAATTIIVNSMGDHEMTIEVDFDDRIVESDESNNTRVETWTWATSPVDLIVEDIWSTTNPLRAGDVEDLTYSIRNNGTADIPVDFHASVFVDGSNVGDSLISGLAAGTSVIRSVAITVTTPGPHGVEVIVDPDEKVPESDEGNNGRAEVWDWEPGPVDLVVEDIWSSTNPLEAGDVEEIVFSIRNSGTAAVTVDFYSELWLDG